MVVATQQEVVTPPNMSVVTLFWRSNISRSVATNLPLPQPSTTSSPSAGFTSEMMSQLGCPLTRAREQHVALAPTVPSSQPCIFERHSLSSGQSLSEGRWPSRVWIIAKLRRRSSESTACSGRMGSRVLATDRPILPRYVSSFMTQKSPCMSMMTRAVVAGLIICRHMWQKTKRRSACAVCVCAPVRCPRVSK